MIDPWALEVLAEAVEPVAPPAGLRARLMAKIADKAAAAGTLAEVRAHEGEWLPLGPPGVDRKMLFRDPATGQKTFLLRLAPGAELPTHQHKTPEQCMVMEGDLGWEGDTYHAGDFVVVAADGDHASVRSENGAIVLIVGG